jgi:peptidyl-prolyl cis-trans isomerase D
MFNLFRSREKSVRYLLGAVLVVISLSMLLYLIPGGSNGPGGAGQNVLATVGKDKITTTDVQGAIERMMSGQRGLPRAFMAMYVPTVVNQYVEMYAKAYKARQMGLSISDEELANSIRRMLTPQMGGKFDQNMYAAMVQDRGFTIPQFESFLRVNLLASRYDEIASQSLVVTDEEARREYQRENEKVGLQFMQFSPKEFTKKVKMDSASINAWFAKHKTEFKVPEKRSFNLVVASDADFAQKVQVTDEDLRRRYQESIDSYRTPERVHVRHILIKTTGVPKDQQAKLHEKAEDILKQLKGGADFAALAKKNSDDPGSAEKGGDLGWIVKGQTVPDFEKAAFSLKPNDLSGVITTEYGFHIIQVLEHQSARVESFEEAKPQLLAEARKEIGADNMQKAVNSARDETARAPSQMEAVAKKYGLRFFKVDNAENSAALPELNSAPEVTNAIFGASKGSVTDVVSVDAAGKAAYAEVTAITPSRPANFDEVQAQVTERYTSEEAGRLMQEAADAAAARVKKGEDFQVVAKSEGAELKTASPFTIMGSAEGIGPATALEQAFGAKSKIGDTFGPISQSGSLFVCKVTAKTPADMTQFAQNRETMIQTLKQKKGELQGGLFGDSLVTDLKRRGVVKLYPQAIQSFAASYKS